MTGQAGGHATHNGLPHFPWMLCPAATTVGRADPAPLQFQESGLEVAHSSMSSTRIAQPGMDDLIATTNGRVYLSII